MNSIKSLIYLILWYAFLGASLRLPRTAGASFIHDIQYSDCRHIERPEIRRICQRLMVPIYNPTTEAGSLRDVRSSDPVALQSFLASDGLGELGKLEAFNQFLAKEDLPLTGAKGPTRFTDDFNGGIWQPMRGKRGDKSSLIHS